MKDKVITQDDPSTWPVFLLEENITAREEQLQTLGSGHQDYAYLLALLSDLWRYKAEQTRDPAHWAQAMAVARTAVSVMLPTEPDVTFIICRLCGLLFRQCKILGKEEDLKELLKLSEQALGAAKNLHSTQWMQARYNYNLYLLEQHKQFGNVQALDDVIEHARLLIELHNDSPGQLSKARLLSHYSIALCEKGCSTRFLPDLYRGIEVGFKAVDACERSDPDYADTVNDLAVRLEQQYVATLLSENLEEGIRLVKQALETESGHGTARPLLLLNHGTFLFHVSERVRNSDPALSLASLADAIAKAKEALTCDEGEWQLDTLIQCMNSLSAWLGLKLKLDGDVASGLEAVEICEEALKLVTPRYKEHTTVLNNLVCTLDALHGALRLTDQDQARRHLEHGIHTAETAVKESNPEDFRHSGRVLNLAAMYAKSYSETLNEDEFQQAKALWLSAASCQSARLVDRIGAGLKAGQACFADSDYEGAYNTLTSAVDMLRKISLRSMSATDRQYLLSQITGIASHAAAATLQLNKSPYEVITTLEIARCVTSRLSIDMKDDMLELKKHHPVLYEQYGRLRQAFSSLHIADTGSEYMSRAQVSKQVSDDLDDLEGKIRQITSFERFQLPPTMDELMALANNGPIVTFNVVRYRSDALIVSSDAITVLALPNLKYNDLESNVKAFGKFCSASRLRKAVPRQPKGTKKDVASILQWLWDVAVKPVLDSIQLTESRRVWWMASGLMSLAPVHAAGNHSKGSHDNTMSHVVSSYISSFKALSHARRPRSETGHSHKVLLVTMPNTPAHQHLDVQAEKLAIRTTFGTNVTEKEQATCDEVLAQMPHHSILHLACHGYLSPTDPSQSGVLLMRGQESDILPIRKIERVVIPNAELAYLSACSTAELTFDRHIDEAISMANCFQILGFRHVIGTMWSASDRSAGVVAHKFYTRLVEQIGSVKATISAGQMETMMQFNAAEILHQAICEYKKECDGEDQMTHWMPYIHVGL